MTDPVRESAIALLTDWSAPDAAQDALRTAREQYPVVIAPTEVEFQAQVNAMAGGPMPVQQQAPAEPTPAQQAPPATRTSRGPHLTRPH